MLHGVHARTRRQDAEYLADLSGGKIGGNITRRVVGRMRDGEIEGQWTSKIGGGAQEGEKRSLCENCWTVGQRRIVVIVRHLFHIM